MVWETASAVFLLIASFPIWIFVALGWGMFSAVASLAVSVSGALNGDGQLVERLLAVLTSSVFEGVHSAWDIPTAIWDWAKYDHPWLAAIIGLVLSGGIGSSSNRRKTFQ